jgi:hypothetical protein
MKTRGKRLIGLVTATVAVAALVSACGGGGTGGGGTGGGGTSPTVSVAVQGAAWVAYQDGANGNWTTLSQAGGFSGSVPSTAPDGRYSLAFVCGGEKPTVHVVHATRQELPSVNFTCDSTPSATVTVSGTVSGLAPGGLAIVSVGSESVNTSGSYNIPSLPVNTYNVLAVRFAGNVPDRVWLRRNLEFSENRTYDINFEQPNDALARVFAVSSGELAVSGVAENETVTARLLFQSGNRASIVGLGANVGLATPTIPYPIFPPGEIRAEERFRVLVETSEKRGLVQVLDTLPSSLTVTLPPPYGNPTLSVNSAGAIQFTAQDFSYSETPAIGYQLNALASSGARYEYFLTQGWLGNAGAYTTPVLETLPGWNSAWNLQRGAAADVALRVYVSPSGATPQSLWGYLQNKPLPNGFTLRYATRQQTLNL